MTAGGPTLKKNSELGRLIWKSLLDADMNYRYFGRCAARYQRWDLGLKIFLAAATSATVSSWAVWNLSGLSVAWKLLTGVSALVALSLPFINMPELLRAASSLRGAWFSILKDYEVLWSRVPDLDDGAARAEYGKIAEEEKKLAELETKIRRRRRLVLACQDEVCRARGLRC